MYTLKKKAICNLLGLGLLWLTNSGQAQTKVQALIPQDEIVMPAVKGGFDLMAYDSRHQRLFLSAQDNHSVEVIDLKNNRPVKSLPGFNEPKWVFYHPETNVLYVATGKDGKVTAVNAANYKTIKTYAFKEKCNNLRYDHRTNQLFVGVGDTFGAIGIIDLNKHKITLQIPLAGFPKQFELTRDRIYVNEPGKGLIEVIDRKTYKVVTTWRVNNHKDNVPMAIDQTKQRLYIGCTGGHLITLSMLNGKEVNRITIPKDVDGIYLDSNRARLYVSCGEGFLDAFSVKRDELSLIQQIRTRNGAGTSLLIPAANLYLLAEPQTDLLPAALRVFQPAL
ncbi:YncE family protein [Mucilaginibacter sp.]|uniref:YncE family protein n=1 Tax=Mucilaginibacter sp. TaxID=1882438 RepID=UPI0035650DB3